MRTSRAPSKGDARVAKCSALLGALLALACSGGTQLGTEVAARPTPGDAPLVDLQPGAWFDANGSLTVVGAGRRLRLVLSAPVSACTSALAADGGVEAAARASLPFHLLAEACRDAHPSILLAEEGDTASPAELERNYHEVARCAGADLALGEGWSPDVVQSADPCPLALGLGWRLPTTNEVSGLTMDDRKAIAGALFDTDVPGTFGSLLVYARDPQGELALATLSPAASDEAPPLRHQKRDQPLFGAALRCVRESAGKPPPLPVLPFAAQCLQEQRKGRALLKGAGVPPPLDLQKLMTWLEGAERQPQVLRSPKHVAELSQLLSSVTLERLAQEAREERALTERYAELAEAVDDPAVSAAERRRRRDEFAHLRRRLGGQIVQTGQGTSSGRTQLAAVISRLELMVRAAATEPPAKKVVRPSYEPILARLRDLGARANP
ncbi:MAG: hypothetical protein K0R38_4974 [Polyangiaceae bacterium]|nr:hypothetical protein [Polyangiaceae bacterium]